MIYHLTAGPFMHPKFNNPFAKKIHKQHPSRCRAESAAEGRVTRHRPMLPMHRVFEPVEAARVAARVAATVAVKEAARVAVKESTSRAATRFICDMVEAFEIIGVPYRVPVTRPAPSGRRRL